MVRAITRWLPAWLLCLSVTVQATVESRIDRTQLDEGETIRYSLNMSGVSGDEIDLSVLEQDFDILGRSQQSSTTIRNGQMKVTSELVLTLLPKRTGALTIPSVSVENDQTQPHRILVKKAQQLSADQGGFEVLASLSSESPKVQQPIIYRASLLVGRQIFNASIEAPTVSGVKALVEPLGEQKQYKQLLKGREITVVEQSWVITPEESGTLEISPARLIGQVHSGPRNRDPFGNYTRAMKRIQVSAQPYSLTVDPIPPQFTGNTWLPAESLKLEQSWQNDSFTLGEPVTRVITLTADGLTSNQLPQLALPEVDGVKQYVAMPETDQHFSDRLISTLKLEVTLIPSKVGVQTLPEIRVPWWDVKANRMREAVLDAVTVEVLPGETGAEAAAPVQLPVESEVTQDVVPQAQETVAATPATQAEETAYSWRNHWWLLLVGVVLGSAATMLLGRLWPKADNGQVGEQEVSTAVSSVLQAQRLLKQACEQNDARAARTALLQWAKAHRPGCKHLNQLAEICPDLKSEINRLNQQAYGRAAENWQGQQLWLQVQKARLGTSEKPAETLEPLYRT